MISQLADDEKQKNGKSKRKLSDMVQNSTEENEHQKHPRIASDNNPNDQTTSFFNNSNNGNTGTMTIVNDLIIEDLFKDIF